MKIFQGEPNYPACRWITLCYALAPGFCMTQQLRFLHVDAKTGQLPARAKKVIAHTPVGRYGNPDDPLGAVSWLLSDTSTFVTGIVIPIDGGFSAYTI